VPWKEEHLPVSFQHVAVVLLPGWLSNEDFTEPFKRRVIRMMDEFNGSV
jgi:hypothetical protein